MAITSKIIRHLLAGGKGVDEMILLADAMDRMSDARLIFECYDDHIFNNIPADESCDILCGVAEEILEQREEYGPYQRNPFEPKFYVYHHIGQTSGEVFYVGKGCADRAKARSNRSAQWKQRFEQEGGFNVVIVKEGMTEPDALAFEQEEIQRLLKIARLENVVGVRV